LGSKIIGVKDNWGQSKINRDLENGLLDGTQLGDVTTERTYNEFGELKTVTAMQESGKGVRLEF